MKQLKVLGMAAGLLFAQAAAAQDPAISTRYSSEEIVQMIRAYKAAYSHDVAPPGNLWQKFQADFPRAYDVEWEAANGIYEVEFEVKRRDLKAFYDSAANLLVVVEDIRRSQLPAVVKNAAESRCPMHHFEDVKKVRCGAEIFYKVEMERGEAEVELLIKSDGTIVEERGE
ncbi:MAG: hypothetical protein LBF55_05850 [Prevotellaceae bacterium]|jgi:hypothetical protein|nr:hypothetical protein [Prevotellaceae bacterium]